MPRVQLLAEIDAEFPARLPIPLHFDRSERAIFILPQDCSHLLLGFDRAPMAQEHFKIRRLGPAQYYILLIVRLAAILTARHTSLRFLLWRTIGKLRERGPAGFIRGLQEIYVQNTSRAGDYLRWLENNETRTPEAASLLREKLLAANSRQPLISVIMPVYDTPARYLREAIESVLGQVYDRWELCIADDNSSAPHVREMLEAYAALDRRIKITFRSTNGHISHATNSALALATGPWAAMLDHDDLLHPHALAEVALEILRQPEALVIYTDEDKLSAAGERYDPYFKPDFSPELFRSQNYLNHLTVFSVRSVKAAGGWRPGFEGSQDYDLALRIIESASIANIRHIPKVLYHWRASPTSTASSGTQKGYAFDAGLKALEDHVKRVNFSASVERAPGTPFYRLRPELPHPLPLVSLIVPTHDKVDLLKTCVDSIIEKTDYPNFEIIIVDNLSREEATEKYLSELGQSSRIKVIQYEHRFNYSAINNLAVAQASGALIGLINNDIEVISPDWLSEMIAWAIQPEVGCVGAKLYYPNDTIQHAGVVLGLGGVAGHSHKHFPRHHTGAFFRLKVVQNVSAVTAACLIVRKEIYEKVGGLDEADLKVAFNDVDFCLKVNQAGYRNVWTPYAELYHHESVSRGSETSRANRKRFAGEMAFMQQKWGNVLREDPFYSPNLTRDREDFSF